MHSRKQKINDVYISKDDTYFDTACELYESKRCRTLGDSINVLSDNENDCNKYDEGELELETFRSCDDIDSTSKKVNNCSYFYRSTSTSLRTQPNAFQCQCCYRVSEVLELDRPITCSFCEKKICGIEINFSAADDLKSTSVKYSSNLCSRQCDICMENFCKNCSTTDYSQQFERFLCIDCSQQWQ